MAPPWKFTCALWALASTVSCAAAQATSLTELCSTSFAQSSLPAADFVPGLTIDADSVETTLVRNASASSEWYPTASFDYCNITFAYSHDGGGGLAINSQKADIPTGVIVIAWDSVFLLANNTINWQSVYMFGYQAHHELATLGKEFARNLYAVNETEKVFSYYQGCSEGGREGWRQLQRFGDQFDGAAIGAPAFRYGQQQVNHLTLNVMEIEADYFPPSCELDKMINLTIAACDPLDGFTDGVVSRSDLCKLHFDTMSMVGEAYSCEATTGPSGGDFAELARRQMPSRATPAQSCTVTAKGAILMKSFFDGLRESEGRLVYINAQPGSSFSDAATTFDEDAETWGVSISGLGGEWVARYLQLQDANTIASLDNVTFDMLKEWMILGQNKYDDSLQTTYPDLADFQAAGGKVIHVHGEADDSIPAGSSVHYFESVRSVMFPDVSYEDGVQQLQDFYRLFLVPGGAHCGSNSAQPRGGWPQSTLQTVIEWVEGKTSPDTLRNTGTNAELCPWPLRPMWSGNGTEAECVSDAAAVATWQYDFDAYRVPLY
ncbi:Tannase like protein [Verticillium longisporum]|uniref:Carboxylic ester hydrolase n=1 Tax=Verticillium longisporum TaxID=100787 RepID=A0A8I2Z8E3_VERLO|nr:Tannase like protein [Verticillium longisporum]